MMERKGDWIETYSGVKFYPLDPRPEDVKLEDIVHALSHQCRFGGHCKQFYSVAQHSLMVSRILKAMGAGPLVQLYGLIHDFAEAYVIDVPRPLKQLIPQLKEIEEKVFTVILEAFDISKPNEWQQEQVNEVDNIVLDWEASALDKNKNGWANRPVFNAELRDVNPEEVKQELMEEFNRLLKKVRKYG
jgi:hypothetical protein